MDWSRIVETDVLVLGSGIAGLAGAIEARRNGARVVVAAQGPIGRPSVSSHAGGQLALHLPPRSERLNDDWMRTSPLTNREVAQALAAQAELLIGGLAEYGVAVRPSDEGGYSIARLPGDTEWPSVRLISQMAQKSRQLGVDLMHGVTVTDLQSVDGRCYGARAFTENGTELEIRAKATVVAIGGAGRLFQPSFGMTGDGFALLLRAGARLVNMEFTKFFPLGLPSVRYPPQRPSRRFYDLEGLRVVNVRGEDLCEKYLGASIRDSLVDLYSRFVTLSWIVTKEWRDGPVYLDLTRVPSAVWDSMVELGVPGLMSRWGASPDLWNKLLSRRILPTRPISHSIAGGALVGSDMSTGVDGLFAGGEVVDAFWELEAQPPYSIGPLPSALITGHIAGHEAARFAKRVTGTLPVSTKWGDAPDEVETYTPSSAATRISSIMLKDGGPLRSRASIEAGLEQLDRLETERRPMPRVSPRDRSRIVGGRSLLMTARAILFAAHLREESRSEHYREDFPAKDDVRWIRPIAVRLNEDGCLTAEEVVENLVGQAT